jgi:hypothetical protein
MTMWEKWLTVWLISYGGQALGWKGINVFSLFLIFDEIL